MSEDNSTVEYRDIPGFLGYRVGNDGSVWSCKIRMAAVSGRGSAFLLSDSLVKAIAQYKNNHGYLCVHLSNSGVAKNVPVHRAVLLAFHGRPLPNQQGRHLNGNKLDNRPENLAWGTAKDNQQDKVRHGTTVKGTRINTCVLTEDQVREVLSSPGTTGRHFAKKFGVSEFAISAIRTGRNWKHIKIHGNGGGGNSNASN